jgi:hypothetical protein
MPNTKRKMILQFSIQPAGAPKYWYSTAPLHGITSQKITTPTFNAMKASNLAWNNYFMARNLVSSLKGNANINYFSN